MTIPLGSLLNVLVLVVLAGFACYRIAQFIVYDDAPFQVMFKIRVWAGRYDLGENGQSRTQLGKLLSCPHCVGVWVAFGLALLLFWRLPAVFLLTWWAISGLQSWLERG